MSDYSNFIYFSTASNNGKPLGDKYPGDGNGFKLGQGSARHYLYKSTSYGNLDRGFDRNGNTVAPIARKSQGYDNAPGRDWIGEFIIQD